MSDLNQWIYIYYINKENRLIFDRTVSRNEYGVRRAKEIVEQHEQRGRESFYTIGTLTKEKAYY